jgi:hypothetical protein
MHDLAGGQKWYRDGSQLSHRQGIECIQLFPDALGSGAMIKCAVNCTQIPH